MKNKGFTLIEIMIALSIAAITITTLYKLHIQNLYTGSYQAFYSVAPLLAQKKIIEVGGNQGNSTGNFEGEFSNYSYKIVTEKIISDDQSKLRVDITISNQNQTFTLRRYIFNNE